MKVWSVLNIVLNKATEIRELCFNLLILEVIIFLTLHLYSFRLGIIIFIIIFSILLISSFLFSILAKIKTSKKNKLMEFVRINFLHKRQSRT